MSDELERRGATARAAVHARTGDLDPSRGLDDVIRRGRRPRTGPVVALLVAAVLAIPTGLWLFGGGEPTVIFDDPSPTATETGEPATPQPTEHTEPGPAPEPGDDATLQPGEPSPTEDEPQDGPTPLGAFDTSEVVTDGFPFGGAGYALLTDVRLAGQGGFDRVVLEFRGEDIPAYRVAYEDPPIIQDGSGDEVDVEGNAFLVVHLTPASGVDMSADAGDSGFELTYEGPTRISGSTGVVTELVRIGDFEANLSWVVGLEREAAFSVTWLSDPLRLVLDIEAP